MYNAKEGSRQAAFNFVKLPLTLIADEKAAVTDADYKDYMNRHKAEFTNDDPSRAIEYVVFDVKPNTEDTANALGELNKIRGDFGTTTSNEDFVNRNSEDRFSDAYVNKARFMSVMADTIFNSADGAVVGPYFENGTYKMTKVIDRKSLPDSVKAQHILIGIANAQNPQGLSDTLAHQRADSIFAAIQAGANFDTLAAKFSDDGSKAQGGDLGYFTYGQMVPQFNEAVFLTGKTGDLKEVKTQFGWHIIRINDQKNFNTAYRVATISKSLNIGEQATNTEYNKANDFRSKATTGAAFDATVKAQNLNKRVADAVKPSDFVLQGLGNSREIIRWAYGAKAGEVSNPFTMDNKFVVAKLAAINEPGLRNLDMATKAQLEPVLRAEKKAKMLADQYKNVSSLEALAQTSGQMVQRADSISATASFAPAVGYEPRVVGYAFYDKLPLNKVSPAIKGRDGVYFIAVTRRGEAAAQVDPMAAAQQSLAQDAQLKGYVGQSASQVLRRQAKVTYKPENIF
jgi:peptidyl-prolyl cis-trans isomerase D